MMWKLEEEKKLVLSTIFSSHHFRESKSKNNKILPPLYPGDISLISVESRKSLTKKIEVQLDEAIAAAVRTLVFPIKIITMSLFYQLLCRSEVIEKSRFLFTFKLHLQMKMTKCNSQSRDSISTKEKFHYALIRNEVLRLCKRLKSAFYKHYVNNYTTSKMANRILISRFGLECKCEKFSGLHLN